MKFSKNWVEGVSKKEGRENTKVVGRMGFSCETALLRKLFFKKTFLNPFFKVKLRNFFLKKKIPGNSKR